jgi:hypothetical protein
MAGTEIGERGTAEYLPNGKSDEKNHLQLCMTKLHPSNFLLSHLHLDPFETIITIIGHSYISRI